MLTTFLIGITIYIIGAFMVQEVWIDRALRWAGKKLELFREKIYVWRIRRRYPNRRVDRA